MARAASEGIVSMKTLIAAISLAVLSVIALAALIDPNIESSTHPTLADAKAGRVFKRGWLPEILPASAADLEVRTSLGENHVHGSFHFAAQDFSAFQHQLLPMTVVASAESSIARDLRERAEDGWTAGIYLDAGSAWIFHCRPAQGFCEYRTSSNALRWVP